jgi:hypothetical protein
MPRRTAAPWVTPPAPRSPTRTLPSLRRTSSLDTATSTTLPHIPPAPPPVSVNLFWFRQVDDTMTPITRDQVARFHAFLNSVHKNIKWTFKSEVDGHINMLDLTILRQSDGSLEFDVYRKPTHTNQYIAWDSDQPLQHKGSTILSLTRRACLLPTGHTRQTAELKRVHQALALNAQCPVMAENCIYLVNFE